MTATPTLYKIYYWGTLHGESLAYIGRTNGPLTQRLRHHFFGHVMQKRVDISRVSRVEYTSLETVADMYVAEIILINQHKPPINRDDKSRDKLTAAFDFDLSFLQWQPWHSKAFGRWKEKLER